MQRQSLAAAIGQIQLYSSKRPWLAILLCALLVFTLLSMPLGILHANEEHYFAIAYRFVNPSWLTNGAIIGNSSHSVAYSWLVGNSINLIGYAPTQVFFSLTLIGLFSGAALAFFRTLNLTIAESLIVLVSFALFGQHLLAGEFLIGNVEPKSFAYPLVILAIAAQLNGRIYLAATLLAFATSFHFLVGGFWFGFLFLLQLWQRQPVRILLRWSAAWFLLSLPILLVIIVGYQDYFREPQVQSAVNSAWIITNYRMPHHVSPFLSLFTAANWAPGIALAMAMTVIAAVITRGANGHLRQISQLMVIVGGSLIAALILSFFDRNTGLIAAFFPFRQSSLMLFLWLALCIVAIRQHLGEALVAPIFFGLALTLTMWWLPRSAYEAIEPMREHPQVASALHPVYEYARSTDPDSVFAVDRYREPDFFSFERNTQRSAFALFKFSPAAGKDLIEWYRRVGIRNKAMTSGCSEDGLKDFDYLVVDANYRERRDRYDLDCLTVAFESDSYAILDARRPPPLREVDDD